MSAQWLVTDGFGGSPGSTKYIVTMGLVPDGIEPPEAPPALQSRTWVGVGIATLIMIMVQLKWP